MHGTIVDNWAAFVSSPTGLWECVCVLVEDLSDLNVCLVSLFIQLLQLLLSILLLLMSFWYPWFLFIYFFVPFLRPSPYLLRQPPTIASAFPQKHRGSILFATKDPFQELFSDISLSVKHSSNPFSEFKSANKSHNPHLLPFCKSPPPHLGVSGALCDSSKGFPLWRALYHLSVCVMVNMHQRAMEWRPPSRAHAPFTLSPTLCH